MGIEKMALSLNMENDVERMLGRGGRGGRLGREAIRSLREMEASSQRTGAEKEISELRVERGRLMKQWPLSDLDRRRLQCLDQLIEAKQDLAQRTPGDGGDLPLYRMRQALAEREA